MSTAARRPEIARLAEHLARHGQRLTRPRLLIAERFLATSGHVSAEDLYHALLDDGAKVGLATVYRTLRTLVAAGLAHERRLAEGAARYELAFGEPPHDHLLCDECGSVTEMSNPLVDQLYELARADHGFAATEHRLTLTGRCRACQLRAERGRV